MLRINSYDIDGVIWRGPNKEGVYPGPNDVIITGRSYEQKDETYAMLRSRGIHNTVFFNPLSREGLDYCRKTSGLHKKEVISALYNIGIVVVQHFEDDPVQAEIVSDATEVVMIGNGVFME